MVIIETSEAPGTGVEDPGLTQGLETFVKATAKVRKVDYEVAKKDSAFAGLTINYLPLYLIKKTDATSKVFDEHIKAGYIKVVGDWIVFEKQTRSGLYIGKPLHKDTLEIFVMSQCHYGVMAENKIIEAKNAGKFPSNVTVNVRFIVNDQGNGQFGSLHGPKEADEDIRQAIIQNKFPSKFWKYLEERNKDYQSENWEAAAKKAGITAKTVKDNWNLGIELLKKDAQASNDYGVSGSPTIIWEGRSVMDFGSLANIAGFEYFGAQSGSGSAPMPAGGC
jgi:hypothetical protein